MLLRLRRHDGKTEEIEVLRGGFAAEIVTSFDWDAERRRFEQLEVAEEECYFPSIFFMDNSGRTLEFGPNSDNTFWISYRYTKLKGTFGFYLAEHGCNQQLQTCGFSDALDLLQHHYAGHHQEIVAFLPAED